MLTIKVAQGGRQDSRKNTTVFFLISIHALVGAHGGFYRTPSSVASSSLLTLLGTFSWKLEPCTVFHNRTILDFLVKAMHTFIGINMVLKNSL